MFSKRIKLVFIEQVCQAVKCDAHWA